MKHIYTQTMGNLYIYSNLADVADEVDIEWWMHYQIPQERLQHHHEDTLEKKPSELPPSTKMPHISAGTGLFTKDFINKGDYVCGIPGYWMHTQLFEYIQDRDPTRCGFTPETGDWPPMNFVTYMSHPCQGNFLNSGTIKGEVHAHITPHKRIMHTSIKTNKSGMHTNCRAGAGYEQLRLGVRRGKVPSQPEEKEDVARRVPGQCVGHQGYPRRR
jgi:hypothetical protein